MSQHHMIFTGSGKRCQRCGIVWDNGEPVDELCQAEQIDMISPADKQSITGEFQPKAEAYAEAFTKQNGGTHYLGLGIQPVTFAMINGLDFCSASSVKYLTRWKKKNGREDLEKAHHFIELREATFTQHSVNRPIIHVRLGMVNYCEANQLDEVTTNALKMLELYYTQRILPEIPMFAIKNIINSL